MKRTIIAISLLVFLSGFCLLSTGQNVYRVPDDFNTIPEALNACSDTEWDEIHLTSHKPYPPFSIVNKKKIRIIDKCNDGWAKIVNPYSNGGYAIHIANSQQIEIRECDILADKYNGHGILAYDNIRLDILDNIIDCRGWGIYINQNGLIWPVTRNDVHENAFYDCKYGVVIHRTVQDQGQIQINITDNYFYKTIYSDIHLNCKASASHSTLLLNRDNDFIDSRLRNMEAYGGTTTLAGNFNFSTPYPLWASGTSVTMTYDDCYFMFCNDRCTPVNGASITELGTQNEYWKCNDY